MTAPVYTRHSEGSNTDVTEWVRELEAERDRLRRALVLIRDYIDGGREAGEVIDIDIHEAAIYNTARAALSASTDMSGLSSTPEAGNKNDITEEGQR